MHESDSRGIEKLLAAVYMDMHLKSLSIYSNDCWGFRDADFLMTLMLMYVSSKKMCL